MNFCAIHDVNWELVCLDRVWSKCLLKDMNLIGFLYYICYLWVKLEIWNCV